MTLSQIKYFMLGISAIKLNEQLSSITNSTVAAQGTQDSIKSIISDIGKAKSELALTKHKLISNNNGRQKL